MPSYISPPPRNPLSALLAGIVGIAMMIGAFMLGFIALVVAMAVGALIWAGIYIRIWWARRQLAKQGIDPDAANPFKTQSSPTKGDSLEGEYTVVSKKQED